jgi:hypothetical protein
MNPAEILAGYAAEVVEGHRQQFKVFAPDCHDPRVRAFEDGPRFVCWRGDEDCAFYKAGPCTAVECTCETVGVCQSCPPPDVRLR